MRQVINIIRGKDVTTATAILVNLNKGACTFVKKTLNSAIANAKVKGFTPEQLYVSKILCDEGPAWKRFKAVAFGRATRIRKRTSHLKIELDVKA